MTEVMNDTQLRESIRERIALGTVAVTPEMSDYMTCQKCQAGFEWQLVGGQGDWRNRIMCEKCFNIVYGVPHGRVIVPLVALQYGLSERDAREREEEIQARWVEKVARASQFS